MRWMTWCTGGPRAQRPRGPERVNAWLVTLAVLALGTLLSTAPAQASFPGQNGRIVFASNATGDYDLYTMNADGSGAVNLTRSPARDDYHAEWSADGNRIAFESGPTGTAALGFAFNDIWVMNADGSEPKRLTGAAGRDGHPSWSPDGDRIAFLSYRDGDGDIYTIRPDGSDLRQLTNLPDDEARPRYSPDGNKLTYTRRVGLGFGGFSIHTIHADGTQDRQLTPASMEAAGSDWSPHGNRLVLHDNFCATCAFSDILVMKANGKGATELTTGFGNNIEASWSPDGRSLLFEHIADPTAARNADVYVMSADGDQRTNLTRSPGVDDILSDWQTR